MRASTLGNRSCSRFLAALGIAALAFGCGGKGDNAKTGTGQPGSTSSDSGPILIGHYGSLTGSEATFGQSTDKGIQMAVAEQNQAGGVKGRQIQLKTYDTQGKTQEAGTAVTRLITDDKAAAIIGEVASSLSLAGGAVAQQYGVPMITPSSTNPRVTQIGNMIFRVCFTDNFQGWAAAKFAHDNLKAAKVAVLYDQGQAYSKGLMDYFADAFKQMGGTITTQQAYTGGDQDFSAQLTTIRQSNPDLIFIPGYYTDAGNISLQVRKLGIKCPLLGGDGWDSAKLAEIGGAAIEGSYFTNHYAPDENRPEVQAFVQKYKAQYGDVPDALAVLGYDAAKLLFDAMKRSPSLAGADLAAALSATRGFPLVTGVVTIDEYRNAKKPAIVVEMRGGHPAYVATIEPPS
jgi:branched-chain amino acid transport system substrate-binding protein